MKKHKSDKQSNINAFYFVLHPYALLFSQSQQNHYTLYLEKNLQILSKFPFPNALPPNYKEVLFPAPEKVDSFRIMSERNMSYHWSIYRVNKNKGQAQEEFVESQKVEMAQFWSEFNANNASIRQEEVIFKKSRCRYSFLMTVGNQKQVLQNIRTYFLARSESATAKKETLVSGQGGKKQFQDKEISAIAPREPAAKYEATKQSPEIVQSQTFKVGSVQVDKKEPAEELSGIVLNKTVSYQILPRQQPKVEGDKKMETPQKMASFIPNDGSLDSMLFSQLKLHLSLSEVEISRDIEQRIKDTEEAVRSPIKQSNGISAINQVSVHDELLSKYRRQKQNRITSSQRLNERGEIMVTPFYYHLKYYLIILAVIVIFAGLVCLNPQAHPHQAFKHKKLKYKTATSKHSARKGK